MPDTLLRYYDRELEAIRKLASEFAQANPTKAPHLRMTAGTVDDPHVERLLEGMAFLAARVQHRLDDEAPELYDALLDLLCPHVLAPVPSMTTVRLLPKPESTTASLVRRGTPLETTQPVRGEVLQYSTCHDVTLWPLDISRATLAGLPLPAPANPYAQGAAAVLRLSLATTVPGLAIADLGPDKLRLHLRSTKPESRQLLELLCTATLSIGLADGPNDPRPTILPPQALSHAGFDAEEAALPRPQRAFSGHRLLTEFFAFPAKFLYIDLSGLHARTLVQRASSMEIFIYLSRNASDFERSVTRENFVLGATPVVNLFKQPAEPVALDGTQSEWLVVPDSRRPAALEVYAIERVRFTRPDAPQPQEVPHFQRLQHHDKAEESADSLRWIASRRAAPAALAGTETRIMLHDPQFDPTRPADGVLSIDTLCCNRDLPSLLPFGGRQPGMRVADATAPVGDVECLTPPTSTLRPQLRERSGWRLVSHLALNHLSVTGGPDAARALREILRLHDLRNAPETQLALDSILSVDAAPGMARLPGAHPGRFARGLDVQLTFEPDAWSSGGLYLPASVLARLFSQQVSVNSFVRTSVRLQGREGIVASWPAQSGTRILL